MDVLHVLHQFFPETNGGSESYVRDIVDVQRARGRDAQVLTGSIQWRPVVEIETLTVDGIPVHRLHRNDFFFDHHIKAWHPGVTREFDALLERLRPAVVHLHHWVRLSSDLVATAHARGIPTVVTLHDYYSSCPRAFRKRPDDPACRRVMSGRNCWDCVPKYGHEPQSELEEGVEVYAASCRHELSLAHSVLVAVGSVADLLAATTGLPRERYEVLPFGYRPRFGGLPPLPAPQPGAPFRFAFWGGVGRHKGVAVLIDAYRRLHARHPRAELHVLGGFESPNHEQHLRELAQGLPVVFHGVFDARQLHAAAPHCGVFPSTCLETFGLVIDECFELGRPCIVSDGGVLAERAGGGGLVAKAGDPAQLAGRMERLLVEPGLWRQLVQDRRPLPPSLEQHVDGLLAVYDRARSTPAPVATVPAVPLARRVNFLMIELDSALTKLCPPGGPQ